GGAHGGHAAGGAGERGSGTGPGPGRVPDRRRALPDGAGGHRVRAAGAADGRGPAGGTAGVPVLRAAGDHQPGGDPVSRAPSRAAGPQARPELLRPAAEGGQLPGVRARRGGAGRGRDPGRAGSAAGSGGTRGAPGVLSPPPLNSLYWHVAYRRVTSDRRPRLPSGHFALTRVRSDRATLSQGPAHHRRGRRLGDPDRRERTRGRARRPRGAAPGPLRRHHRRRRHGAQGQRRHPGRGRRRPPPPAARAAHQLGLPAGRVPGPGPAARRLPVRGGELQRARFLAVRRTDRGRRAGRHRRRLPGDRLGPRAHPRRPRPHRHGGRLLRRRHQPAGRRARPAGQSGRRAQRPGRPDRVDLLRTDPGPPGRPRAGPRGTPDPPRAPAPADPRGIGMAGVSYGAGISLLAAAHDRRVGAVAALSGWADLIESIYSERTQHVQAASVLDGVGRLTGRPSPELRRIFDALYASDLSREQEMIAWGKVRSPATYVDRLNDSGAAVMLAGAWGDTVFPPNQYADLYEKLSGPKRLQLRPGDHATPELTGLFGLPNDVWTDTRRWFDHHLRGIANGVGTEQPVRLTSRSSGRHETYPDWKSVAATTRKIELGGSTTIRTNVNSGADGGVVSLSSILDQVARLPPMAWVPLLPRRWAAVWQSERYPTVRQVRGTPRLHTTLTPTAGSGTFIAYLYDV